MVKNILTLTAPKQRSSADSVRLGGISGAGNALVRKLAVEGSWCYAQAGHQPKLMPKGSGVPLEIRMHGRKGSERLLRRREEMIARGMPQAKANAATAAELVRWLGPSARCAGRARNRHKPPSRRAGRPSGTPPFSLCARRPPHARRQTRGTPPKERIAGRRSGIRGYETESKASMTCRGRTGTGLTAGPADRLQAVGGAIVALDSGLGHMSERAPERTNWHEKRTA